MDIQGLQAQFQAEGRSMLSSKRAGHREAAPPLGYDSRGFINLNMLADCKRSASKCELCENTGILMCAACKVTYYCSVKHFLLDKDFHSGLCSRVRIVREPLEFSPLRENRERSKAQRRMRMEELYVYAWKKSQEDLDKGFFSAAIPAATVATNYAQILYGQDEEMILPMLVAAESHLRQGNVGMAEGFVARALSIELNKPNMRPSIKAKIRHNEGIVAMAKDNLQEALVNFAEEVYQTSVEYGPTHRKTAMGYCNLGRLFHLTEEFPTSISLFRQVVDIWTAFVEPILDEMTAETIVPKISALKIKERIWMEDGDKFEAEDVLMHCYNHQLECYKKKPPAINPEDLARTCYTLAVLYYISKRLQEADKIVAEALGYLEEGEAKEPLLVKKLLWVQKLVNRKSAHFEYLELDRPDLDLGGSSSSCVARDF